MARPIKTGLDYFPFDVDFFNDESIVCISGEFGLKGELAAVKLLCAIFRRGYFVEWEESMKVKLLRDLPTVSSDLLEDIVRRLVRWGFFDKDLFDSVHILTSERIQRRYFAAMRRNHLPDDLPHVYGFLQHYVDRNRVNVYKNRVIADREKEKKKEKEVFPPHPLLQEKEKIKKEKESGPRARGREISDSSLPAGLTREALLEAVKALEFADYDATKADAIAFYDHYAATGWIMGPGIPMRDWRAAFRSWLNKRGSFDRSTSSRKKSAAPALPAPRETKPDAPAAPSEPKATAAEVDAILKSSGFYDRVQAAGKRK